MEINLQLKIKELKEENQILLAQTKEIEQMKKNIAFSTEEMKKRELLIQERDEIIAQYDSKIKEMESLNEKKIDAIHQKHEEDLKFKIFEIQNENESLVNVIFSFLTNLILYKKATKK